VKRTGRPKKQIDMQQLEALCRIQCTEEEIAAVLGVSTEWLRYNKKNKAFLEVMQSGREKGKTSLRRKQYEMAMMGDRVMLIWLGKQYLGQSDKMEQAVTGDKDMTVKVVYENDAPLPGAGS
jgi:hypothetical protein